MNLDRPRERPLGPPRAAAVAPGLRPATKSGVTRQFLQRRIKGFAGAPVAVEIRTLLVSRYSRMASIALSRPRHIVSIPVRNHVADRPICVDPHCFGLQGRRHADRSADIRSPDTCRQAPDRIILELNGFDLVLKPRMERMGPNTSSRAIRISGLRP